MKPNFKMENWGVIYRDQDPYKAPELRSAVLVGDRYGPGDDVKNVITSSILGKSGKYVVTKNSLYDLGEPDPGYEALYTNAKVRLFATLTEIEL